MGDNDRGPRRKIGKPCRDTCRGMWEGAPKGRGEKNLLEGSKGQKVTGDESTRHSDGKIGHCTLRQLCKAIPCCAKVWLNSEARRADVQCASTKFVQTHCQGQYPSM